MAKRLIFFDHFMFNLNPDCRKIVLLGKKFILSEQKQLQKYWKHTFNKHVYKILAVRFYQVVWFIFSVFFWNGGVFKGKCIHLNATIAVSPRIGTINALFFILQMILQTV